MEINLFELAEYMNQPVLIDGRNIYAENQIADTSFQYYSVGRPGLTNIDGRKQQSFNGGSDMKLGIKISLGIFSFWSWC